MNFLSFAKFRSRENMIFDIYAKIVNNRLVFDLPYHEFQWTDQIALRRLIIDWRTKEKTFAVLRSNLVDLGPENPKQQLVSIIKSGYSTITDIQVSNPVFYRVQIQQLENASISLEPMFDRAIPQIRNIYLQLECISE